jgi:hypothetical protein
MICNNLVFKLDICTNGSNLFYFVAIVVVAAA